MYCECGHFIWIDFYHRGISRIACISNVMHWRPCQLYQKYISDDDTCLLQFILLFPQYLYGSASIDKVQHQKYKCSRKKKKKTFWYIQFWNTINKCLKKNDFKIIDVSTNLILSFPFYLDMTCSYYWILLALHQYKL